MPDSIALLLIVAAVIYLAVVIPKLNDKPGVAAPGESNN